MTSKQSLLLCSLVALSAATTANSFQLGIDTHPSLHSHTHHSSSSSSRSSTRLHSDATKGKNGKTKFGQRTDAEVSRFLTDFRTADGELVDPYKLLRVKRGASKTEIKQSYRRLSRKLHPDTVAQTDILPGTCANLQEVREEWERVQFSYEILSDPKTRKSYDRNSSVAEVLEDPGGAVGRAVVGGAMGGIGLVLGGTWKLGEMATKKAFEMAVNTSGREEPARKNSALSSTNNNGGGGDGNNTASSPEMAAANNGAVVAVANNNNFGPTGGDSATERFGPVGVVEKKGYYDPETNTIKVLAPGASAPATVATKKSKSKQ